MTQLSLFRHWRKRRVRTPKEFVTQCDLVRILRVARMPGWMFTHLPMGEKRDPATARRLKDMGVTPGWPDLLFIGPGTVLFMELKREGLDPERELSDEQREMRRHIEDCGFTYLLPDGLQAAVQALQHWGCIRPGVRVT